MCGRSLLRVVFSSVGLLVGLSASQAADLALRKAQPLPVLSSLYNWTGFYAGFNVTDHNGDITVNCPPPNVCGTNSKLRGTYVAFQGGYDYQLANNWVVGVVVQVPLSRFSTDNPFAGISFVTEPQWAFGAGVRLGYAIDRLLPYVGIGFQQSKVRVTRTAGFPPVVENTHTGPVFVFGAEYAFLDNFTVYGQYMRGHMGLKQYDFGGGFEEFGEDSDSFAIGANYRFGARR